MNRKILGVTAALALAAGCEFAEKTEWEGPIAQCRTAGAACTENAECCSYGCELGICQENPVLGGVCKTTDDCGYSSATQMLCKSGSCSVPVGPYYCRDDADVCNFFDDCCSSHCTGTGGTCVPNAAPVVQMGPAIQEVPRNQPWTLINESFDPDTGETLTLDYGWTITPITSPAPPGWSLSDPALKNPVFTPGTGIASYRVDLDVTDDWGLTSSGSVTLNVINFPPAVTPVATTATTPRGIALDVRMKVSDANGDVIDCTWSICRPDDPAACLTVPAPLLDLPGLPESERVAPFPTGIAPNDEGAWTVSLICSDTLAATGTGSTTVTVTNTAPVVIVPATRTYNLAFDPASTPEQLITATHTDENGDAIATWSWSVSAPEPVTPTGATTATVGFAPNVNGVFNFTVTGCDAPVNNPPYVVRDGACDTATVVATVYPYIRPITATPGSVIDAEWRKAGATEALIAVGMDGASANRLWIANPAADPGTTPDVTVGLGAIPVAVSLSGDGLNALVGEQTGRWQTVAVGTTPAASSLYTSPLTITDVVHFDSSGGYALGTGGTSAIYELALSTGASSPMTCRNLGCTLSGTRAVGDGSRLWVLDDAANTVAAYQELGGELDRVASNSAPSTATGIWRSSDTDYLFMNGTDGIVFTNNLAGSASLPAYTWHADSSLADAALVGLAATSSTVTPFSGANFTAGTPIALPHWGSGGADRTLTARYSFVSADGKKAHVVVETDDASAWGLYSCTLPCTLP